MDPFAVIALIVIPLFAIFMLIWAVCDAASGADEALERRIYNWEDE